MDKDYVKSLSRCPLCGKLIGCTESDTSVVCDLIELKKHVEECRKRVKSMDSLKFDDRLS